MHHALGDGVIADISVALREAIAVSRVAGIVVSPDVFEALQRYADNPSNAPIHCGGIDVFVCRSLARGSIVPVDRDGQPLPKGSAVRVSHDD